VFTVSQSEVVQMFGSSLVVYSLIPVMAIGRISLKGRPFLDETPDIKENTSSRRLGNNGPFSQILYIPNVYSV
jgi:hypothetical protein